MKKLFLLTPLIMIFFLSCSEEKVENIENDATIVEDYDFIQTYIYKDKTYALKFEDTGEGTSKMVSEVPKELENLDNLPELSTVVTPEGIYFFDNEREEFEYFGQDYDLLLESRKNNENGLASRATLNISEFNDQVRCYEHDYWSGRRMYISSASDLKNLRDCNFNDIMSSVAIWLFYQSPIPGIEVPNFSLNYVKFYEHSKWSGKSLSFKDWRKQFNYPGGNGRDYMGHHKFRDLKMTWTRRWADKVTSIDVIRDGQSIVR